MARGKKVVALAEHEKVRQEAEGALFAEAMAKTEPSAEAKALIDGWLKDETEAWRKPGDLGARALDLAFENFWLGYYTKAGALHGAQLLKQELGYEGATGAERVLIEHAVLCHVRLGIVEHLYSRNTSKRMDIAEHYERRLTLAQKRFTRAVETLARVRALLARAEVAQEQARKSSGPWSLNRGAA